MQQLVNRSEAFENFCAAVRARGVRDGLAYLLSLSEYRFIGIWRFEGGRANAAVHFDRENPDVTSAVEVAEDATYCCYVRDSKGVFMTAHAMLDDRTLGHPARQAVPAYCGIPVMDAEGELLGTLCHYDLVPRDPEQVDLELMIQVASFLSQGKYVPPYPTKA